VLGNDTGIVSAVWSARRVLTIFMGAGSQQRYVTSRELVAEIGTKSRYVTVLLREAGIRPVADPDILPGFRRSLHRRSKVPKDLAVRRETAFPRRRDAPACGAETSVIQNRYV
jgi:hypothetical protein